MLDLAVIILTGNEHLHIARAVDNIRPIAKEIFVVDSFSRDDTVAIAEAHGARVYQNKWENNHAKQFNWALSNLPITAGWILRLDADEYLSEALIEEVKAKLPLLDDDVTGVTLSCRQYFFGKLLHPLRILRLFRRGKAECELRWMDEHIMITEGRTADFDGFFVNHALNTLGWWIDKHNGYSIREAIDLLNMELGLFPVLATSGNMGDAAEAKRKKKLRYARAPLFWRSAAYFVYRYIFKFGFVKGKAQFMWDFFQGWWYRTLVDAKIYEIKRACGNDREKILDFIRDNYGIDCRKI